MAESGASSETDFKPADTISSSSSCASRCGKPLEENRKDAVKCAVCNDYFHKSPCADLKPTEIDALEVGGALKYHCFSCQSLDRGNNLGKFERFTKPAMKYEDATTQTEERFLEPDFISMANQLEIDEAKIELTDRKQNESLIQVFEFLDTKSILNAALVCKG